MHGDPEAVQQHVLADAAVLREREFMYGGTPLMSAIDYHKPAIALWLIQHRGQHDVKAGSNTRYTALHTASEEGGSLEVVQALVAAGANPAALTCGRLTPLNFASARGHTEIVVFLLQLPVVKATIDAIDRDQGTTLSRASYWGHQPVVRLLLDAGADPTIPGRKHSPLCQALNQNYHGIAALLHHAIAEAERAHALHKIRSLLDAGAAALACLQGRVEQGQALPQAELTPDKDGEGEEELQQEMLEYLQQHQLQQNQQQQEQEGSKQEEQGDDEGEQEELPATEASAVEVSSLLFGGRIRKMMGESLVQLQRMSLGHKLLRRAVAAFAVSGGEKEDSGLDEELYMKVLKAVSQEQELFGQYCGLAMTEAAAVGLSGGEESSTLQEDSAKLREALSQMRRQLQEPKLRATVAFVVGFRTGRRTQECVTICTRSCRGTCCRCGRTRAGGSSGLKREEEAKRMRGRGRSWHGLVSFFEVKAIVSHAFVP